MVFVIQLEGVSAYRQWQRWGWTKIQMQLGSDTKVGVAVQVPVVVPMQYFGLFLVSMWQSTLHVHILLITLKIKWFLLIINMGFQCTKVCLIWILFAKVIRAQSSLIDATKINTKAWRYGGGHYTNPDVLIMSDFRLLLSTLSILPKKCDPKTCISPQLTHFSWGY